eukprot:3786239-Pyramimonas_sp.AAC.1
MSSNCATAATSVGSWAAGRSSGVRGPSRNQVAPWVAANCVIVTTFGTFWEAPQNNGLTGSNRDLADSWAAANCATAPLGALCPALARP